MKVTTQELERCETLLTIEFDPHKEEDFLKKAAKRIAREVNIPGFRRGKAPFNTIVRRFGIEAIQQEAMDEMGDKIIKDALDEVDIQPFAQIQLEEIKWDPLVINLKVPTMPKVELGDYRALRLDFEPVEVTDQDVADALQSLQEQNAIWSPVERPAEIGDLISMTITEKDGDELLVENESVEYELTEPDEEEESKRPDLATPLLGLSAGEHKTFTITYPEAFSNEDYAGKEITVNVEVSGVKVKELDPLDDEFAQQISDFETLEELKENIHNNLYRQRERQRDHELGTQMVEKIIEDARLIEWPQALEEEEIDGELERTERRIKNAGFTLEGYLQMQQKTREAWREEMREGAVDRLRRGLVLSQVAVLEGLEVSNSEVLEQAKLIADMSGGGEQLWRSILSSQTQQGLIANDVMSSKAIERLAAIARDEAPEPGAEEEPAEPEIADETASTDDDAEEAGAYDAPDTSGAEEEAVEEVEDNV